MKVGNSSGERITDYTICREKDKATDFHKIIQGMEGKKEEITQKKENDSAVDYRALLSEHITSLQEKLLKGEAQEKFQIGNKSMTVKEWNSILENFDSLQEEIVFGMRQRHESEAEQQEKREELQEILAKKELIKKLCEEKSL